METSREEMMSWAEDFESSMGKRGWIVQFAMCGPDNPLDCVIELGGKFRDWRDYNARMWEIVNSHGKMETLKRFLKSELSYKGRGLEGYGKVVRKDYAEKLLVNFIARNGDWF